ncbi:TetR/AcrR family transcriptional regulator [Streptomyces spinosirectus]|jgi:AcrR family transcriptional regulator|uniref:TetR/AcrR family transcriptional regulator n=1 Tax=Streptomyces TaxID=1883 RepID=UPI000D335C56|nr:MULTISPECIES: TetR/AcrR family transcriptional regulator [Streptomyces]MBY8344442.1 TetR family transcriptional regulator [Streptomyces plumbidurans]PTM85574.1 TetR family transcriptional regulator [Streptomyces sp. VMFN-G11Ma]UIR19485.1 TetR/AcrR family transcriptional regulator [Streptomyces spinosirectus]
MTAETMGLRERKKRQTAMRIWQVAVELFTERGFDNVSVQEVADAAEVSKMTVFNYFGTKEDLVFRPMEEHFQDAARAVREREPGESAVQAVRRQFLSMIETRDPSIGLHSEPFARQVRQLVADTPVLMERAFLSAQQGTRDLAALLAEETGDLMLATVAAAMLSAARNALVEEHHRRITAGEPVDTVAADATARAEQAFALVEQGLGTYARKAGI